jgi:hypothetical protein
VAKKSPETGLKYSRRGGASLLGILIGPILWVWCFCFLIWYFMQPGFFGEYRIADMLGLLLPEELLRATWQGPGEYRGVGGLDRVGPMLLALGWLGLGYLVGRPITEPLFCTLTRMESAALSVLVGLALLSTSVLLLGLTGLLHRFGLIISVACLLLLSFLLRKSTAVSSSIQRQGSRSGSPKLEGGSQISRWSWRLLQAATVTLALMYILNAAMPPFEFDVVEYHLQGPKEFFQAGRINYVAHNVYLNMPLGVEMHSLAAMVTVGGSDGWWWGGLAGKMISGLLSLVAALLAAGFACRHFGVVAGWITAALLLSSPGNIHVAGCGLIDSALGAYFLGSLVSLLCFFQLLKAAETELMMTENAVGEHELKISRLGNDSIFAAALVTSLLSGSAVACKYTGLIYVWLPCTAAILIGGFAQTHRAGLLAFGRLAFVIFIGFTVTGAPWLIKNAMAVGNPVFPLAYQILGGPEADWTADQATRWSNAHHPASSSEMTGATGIQATYGFSAMTSSLHRVIVGSPYLPPALIPLVLIGLTVCVIKLGSGSAHRSGKRLGSGLNRQWDIDPILLSALLMIWCFGIWWLFTHRIDRFWLPLLPLMAVIAASAAGSISRNPQPGWLIFPVLISVIYGNTVSISGVLCDQRWFVPYHNLRLDGGDQQRAGRIPQTTEWVNRGLERANILLIGEARVYDFLPSVHYATCFNYPPGEKQLRNQPAAKQKAWLKEQQITHIMVHWREITRYRSSGNYGFSEWPVPEDIEQMVESGVVKPVDDWPFEMTEVMLLQVVGD